VATLRSLTIQNFKGIKDPVKIDLRPITLLFGPNSAGKSTIIKALAYAREIFVNRNPDPHRCTIQGERVDIGKFHEVIHNHDVLSPMLFGIEVELTDYESLSVRRMPDPLDPIMALVAGKQPKMADNPDFPSDVKLSGVKRVLVSVCLQQHPSISNPTPYVKYYSVSLNDEFFCQIDDEGPQAYEKYVVSVPETDEQKKNKKFFGKLWPSPKMAHFAMARLNFRHTLFQQKTATASDPNMAKVAEEAFKKCWSGDPDNKAETGIFISFGNALPEWDRSLDFFAGLNVAQGTDKKELNGFMNGAVVGAGQLVRDVLQSMRYLGPLRAVPPRFLDEDRLAEEVGASSGLDLWKELFNADSFTRRAINEWMGPTQLDTGYRIDLKQSIEVDPDRLWEIQEEILEGAGHRGPDALDVVDRLQGLPKGSPKLILHQINTDIDLSLHDVGTGISQVMPVVIAALISSGGVLAIEQPELHIHPALQVKLGDLFISRIKDSGCLFILETHSEHLLLRIMRRMRETSSGDLPENVAPVTPKDVSVLYVQPKGTSSVVRCLALDEEGQLLDAWPGGFFEEGYRERFP
jgi:hypothetical protein